MSASPAIASKSLASPLHRFAKLLVALTVLVLPTVAAADQRTDFLITRLQYPPVQGVSDDFRVRTNAALALGATNDEAAVQPLCRGLDDPNDVVRQSVAVAMKRLAKPSALNCLKAHLSTEYSSAVKLQMTRAIAELESGGNAAASSTGGTADTYTPKNNPSAKFYIATSAITNNTGRAQADVDRIVLSSVRGKLDAMGKYQIAPAGEGGDSAKATIVKRKLKGFYLSLSVDKFDYSGGNLRVRVRCSVFTYPGKSLLGEVPSGLTQSGVTQPDKSAEENLMQMAAERAVELFAENFN
ncbi:MAG: HEAT repeat domain-containing protein [Polyangiaceae bacterium]